ncbi:hypothetical protein PMAYCL1PPCAC_24407 [Pristionchus mayeri]|uniref:Amino acid transporter transmembrane domain-containing protein n=1 Tax=Pristionchus mayeri TaxID=1317129 RepID=A0AAN5D131_9BILA|nr:hypothetical protein PMAYCL1PPCAC_24407 [Pristionchus mayeri]
MQKEGSSSTLSNISLTSRASELDSQKKKEVEELPHNHHGFHWLVCAVLIVGDMAGGGLVALPSSFVNSGLWAGIAMTIISAFLSAYTGVQLGDNWLMMQERWSEYKESCRKPYPEMGFRALGRGGRILVSIIITVQQFGLSVVFLLLASNNISSFLFAFWQLKINFCFIALVVAVFISPFLMLGSAKDFWQAGFVAMCSTCVAVILMIVGIIHDWGKCAPEVDFPPVVFNKFFLAYGTIMFAYGGHSVFPSFQHDMKTPKDFATSVISGYILILIMYLPVSVLGYLVYGGSQGGTIITSLQLTWVQQTVNVLITVHVVFTQVIICSPLSLQIEEIFKVPNKFGLRRVIVRLIIVLCVLFTALSIPKFGPILDLIGGTTITMLTMLLPAIFNLFLVASTKKWKESTGGQWTPQEVSIYASISDVFRYNSWWILLLNLFVLAFGIIGGVASTLSAVVELINTEWELPCYVELFMGKLQFNGDGGGVSCCGVNQDIVTLKGVDPYGFCAALTSNTTITTTTAFYS